MDGGREAVVFPLKANPVISPNYAFRKAAALLFVPERAVMSFTVRISESVASIASDMAISLELTPTPNPKQNFLKLHEAGDKDIPHQ
jgi:hypothetical protein